MLEQMSFLEKGVSKFMLTPNLIQYVDMSITPESKAQHMDVISKYYIIILEEFFTVNSGNKSQHSRNTESDASSFHFTDMMEHKMKTVEKNVKLKTIFEKVINELQNIEYALNYFIGVSEKNKKKRFSRIESNDSIHLKNQNQAKPHNPKKLSASSTVEIN